MKVAIVHPWLPQYRVGFFEQLVLAGNREGIEFHIFHGDVPLEWRSRNDAGQSNVSQKLPTRFMKIRGRSLNYKSLEKLRRQGPYDLIVVEQAVRNLETYQLLLTRTPIAFWGHGKTYTQRSSRGKERIKHWLTNRGIWFFAYTSKGAEEVVSQGMAPERTTVVQNATDARHLSSAISSLEKSEIRSFEAKNDLHGKTALFIGGLDASKRLTFLLAAAEIAHENDSEFRLVIAGDGVDRVLVQEKAAQCPYIKYVGPLFGRDKAVAISASQVMAMPGRVGLVAVDSFAGGKPIVTTDWKWHAPEFEYLESGVNAIVTRDAPEAYAAELLVTLRDQQKLSMLSANCLESSAKYTVEAMVENFVTGVKNALKGAA